MNARIRPQAAFLVAVGLAAFSAPPRFVQAQALPPSNPTTGMTAATTTGTTATTTAGTATTGMATGATTGTTGTTEATTTGSMTAPTSAGYQILPVVRQGDTVAGVTIKRGAYFQLGPLNDQGQLLIDAENAAGGEALLQYAGGQFTLIAAGGRPAPTGRWPAHVVFNGPPVSMNQTGTVVFNAIDPQASSFLAGFLGIFRWDGAEQKVTPMVMKGMRAVTGQTIEAAGYAIINDHGDIAFQAFASPGLWSLFFLSQDGKLKTVALGGQAMPGGGTTALAYPLSLSNADVVVFVAAGQPDGRPLGIYRWENGTITPVLKFGAPAPGGGVFVNAAWAQVNNLDRSVLVAAAVADRQHSGTSDANVPPTGLYWFGDDGLAHPIVVPGQAMPGGGAFQSFGVLPGSGGGAAVYPGGVSGDGRTVFQAQLTDGSRGLYLADGSGLSLVLKEGATTPLGKVTRLGTGLNDSTIGMSINHHGEVAVPVQFDNGPGTIVVLTPVTGSVGGCGAGTHDAGTTTGFQP